MRSLHFQRRLCQLIGVVLVCASLAYAQGIISTVAGNGKAGFSGDGGPATGAQLYNPFGVAVDATGNLYIADTSNSRIRKVIPGGTITTVAGNANGLFSGDGGPATSASIGDPWGVAVDAAGNLYIADAANSLIRKVATKAPFTVNHVIKFAPGTEGQRAALKKMAVVGGMVDGDFVTANEDLNDDGSKEIIVMSFYTGQSSNEVLRSTKSSVSDG